MSTVKTKIAPEFVLAFLQKNFDNSVKNIEFIKGGEMSQAFSFKGKEGNFVIRVNTNNRSFCKDDYAHKHFTTKDIPIPEIIQISKLDDVYHFAISRKAEGKHINDLTKDEFSKTLPSLLGVLDAIHSTDMADAIGYGKWDKQGKGSHNTWREYVLSGNNFPDEKNLFETSFLEKDVWQKIYSNIEKLAEFCPEEKYLIHGDYSNNNVVSNGEKITGVFDWDGSAYGDFVFDIAWMTFWLSQPDRIQATENYYEHRNIPNFKERLLCYKLRIGLVSMGFYALSNQREKYDFAKKKTLSLYDENIESIPQIKFAIEFATKKFQEKGIGNHFLDVLAILQKEFGVDDADLFVSAVLHDTLEDTDTTYEELEQVFSKAVADLVQEVSHPKNYNKAQKAEYYESLKHISSKAKILKLADFASNLRAIIKIRKSEPEKPYHNQYIILIRSFLQSCPESEAKEVVYELTNELEKYVTIINI